MLLGAGRKREKKIFSVLCVKIKIITCYLHKCENFEVGVLYTKTQSIPRCKHFSSLL